LSLIVVNGRDGAGQKHCGALPAITPFLPLKVQGSTSNNHRL
jgi:hypothetical protein